MNILVFLPILHIDKMIACIHDSEMEAKGSDKLRKLWTCQYYQNSHGEVQEVIKKSKGERKQGTSNDIQLEVLNMSNMLLKLEIM